MKYFIALFLSLLFSTSVFADSFSQYSSGQILGTNTNDNACAGCVGEVLSQSISAASQIAIPNSTVTAIATITLTPGDWDVSGVCSITPSATAATVTYTQCGINTSATVFGGVTGGNSSNPSVYTAGGALVQSLPTGIRQVQVASGSTTQIWMLGQILFSGTVSNAYGFIRARRVR